MKILKTFYDNNANMYLTVNESRCWNICNLNAHAKPNPIYCPQNIQQNNPADGSTAEKFPKHIVLYKLFCA